MMYCCRAIEAEPGQAHRGGFTNGEWRLTTGERLAAGFFYTGQETPTGLLQPPHGCYKNRLRSRQAS